MIDLRSFENRLLYSTVRIVGTKSDGTTSIGTGFYYLFYDSPRSRNLPVLVTNKHVIDDTVTGKLDVHMGQKGEGDEASPLPESFTVTIEQNFEKAWTCHPGGVDLCVMPIQGISNVLASQGKLLYYHALGEDLVPENETLESLNAFEEVSMVGYPIGLWDEKNNFPVLRRGITASHPFFDFKGKPEGVVDIAAFPGSSGSPVMILDQVGPFSSIMTRLGPPRTFLLGVLSSGPMMDAKGTIRIVEIPTTKMAETHTAVSVHLGYYIKARELLVLKQHVFGLMGVK